MTRIKICGLTSPDHAALAANLGADFIGLVFAEGSRRRVTIHQAKAIVGALPVPATIGHSAESPQADATPLRWFDSSALYLHERLQRKRPLVVGVFANQSSTIVNAVADRVGLDLVQLHGDEPWEEALAIRRPVIKALRVSGGIPASALLSQIEVGTASLCLLDADIPGRLGGTGQQIDWGVAAEMAAEMPIMLAGGLNPLNVSDAIESVRPWAVDVSSGIELHGVKHALLIRDFIDAVQSTG
jgi:anthranilate synthase/indole-3-glycerol phosphate synthase/phosphoribosylanthranilate isomerase